MKETSHMRRSLWRGFVRPFLIASALFAAYSLLVLSVASAAPAPSAETATLTAMWLGFVPVMAMYGLGVWAFRARHRLVPIVAVALILALLFAPSLSAFYWVDSCGWACVWHVIWGD